MIVDQRLNIASYPRHQKQLRKACDSPSWETINGLLRITPKRGTDSQILTTTIIDRRSARCTSAKLDIFALVEFIQAARGENRSIGEVQTESTASMALRCYGNPSEYGDVAAFLASERASYITGSVIRVDGDLIASV